MKYLPLVLAGLLRRRARSVLTIFSIATAFLLYGALNGARVGLDQVLSDTTDKLELVTLNRINAGMPLPYAYLSQIERLPGVESVDFYQPFGGFYREPRNRVGGTAIDPERYFRDPTPDFIASREHLDALAKLRTGALAGEDVARRYGWKIGDRITVRSPGFIRKDRSSDWTFDIVGTYRRPGGTAEGLRIQYKYLDEARARGAGTVGGIRSRVADGNQSAVAARIDNLFANSGASTRTQTEADLVRSQISQIGDIELVIGSVVGAVFFTLLFVAGNTMMESVRERIPELAVLKAYGYSDRRVAMLVLTEALVLCVGGACIGLGLAAVLFPVGYMAAGIAPHGIDGSVLVLGITVATLLSLVVAVVPVWRVHRLTIIDALAVR